MLLTISLSLQEILICESLAIQTAEMYTKSKVWILYKLIKLGQ